MERLTALGFVRQTGSAPPLEACRRVTTRRCSLENRLVVQRAAPKRKTILCTENESPAGRKIVGVVARRWTTELNPLIDSQLNRRRCSEARRVRLATGVWPSKFPFASRERNLRADLPWSRHVGIYRLSYDQRAVQFGVPAEPEPFVHRSALGSRLHELPSANKTPPMPTTDW